ncbi:unnamed protein product [Phaeothamnion confervicola]
MNKLSFYELELVVVARLGHGEKVHVCGSCAALGDNDPERSVPLNTDPRSYPYWRSNPLPMPLNQIVTYKYCVYSGGEFRRWEDIPVPRILDAVTGNGPPPEPPEDVLDQLDDAEAVAAGPGDDSDSGMGVESTTAGIGRLSLDLSHEESRSGPGAGAGLRPRRLRRGASGGGMVGGMAGGGGAAGGSGFVALGDRDPLRRSVQFARTHSVVRPEQYPAQDVSISSFDGVVVVSLFLPVIVTRAAAAGPDDAVGRWQVEWDYENLLSLHNNASIGLRVTRVGVVRYDGVIAPEDEEALTRELARFDCVPVFLEKTMARKFYRDFCKGVLWPVFHHVVDVYGDLVSDGGG